MRPKLNKAYASLSGLGAAATAVQMISSGEYLRGATGIAIGLIALSDAFIWSRKGVVYPPPLSWPNYLDTFGVMAGFAAQIFALIPNPGRLWPSASIASALVYIATCLAYWIILPRYARLYDGIRSAAKLTSSDRNWFVALFACCVVVLSAILVCGLRNHPWTEALFSIAVALYLTVYFVLLVVPVLRSWTPTDDIAKQEEE